MPYGMQEEEFSVLESCRLCSFSCLKFAKQAFDEFISVCASCSSIRSIAGFYLWQKGQEHGAYQYINKSINQSINQLIDQSTKTSINQSIDRLVNQTITQPIHLSTDKLINNLINQSINQPINQSINQSIKKK